MEELTILKKMCKLWQNDRLREYQYKLMDALGLDIPNRQEDKKLVLLRKYLKKKYKMGQKDMNEVIRYLGNKFKEKDLMEVLGEQG